MPSVMIGRAIDLFFYNGTADPLPFIRFAMLQDQENRLCFQPYTILTLIVKRPVQATNVEIDSWHEAFIAWY